MDQAFCLDGWWEVGFWCSARRGEDLVGLADLRVLKELGGLYPAGFPQKNTGQAGQAGPGR
jgi:hypothetical protein